MGKRLLKNPQCLWIYEKFHVGEMYRVYVIYKVI